MPGPGFGFVNVFDANGNLIRRFASRGRLNAVGSGIGAGRFRTVQQHAVDRKLRRRPDQRLRPPERRGRLRTSDGEPITIDRLWGIAFGNGVFNQPTKVLFFAAGRATSSTGFTVASRLSRRTMTSNSPANSAVLSCP